MSIRRELSAPHKRLDALSLAHRLWEAIDTPIALSCHILAKAGEFEQLVGKQVDPLSYSTPLKFALDYQCVKLLSRYPYLETGIDTKHVAYQSFIESETKCRLTNERFRSGDFSHLSESVRRALFGAQRKIATILGSVPSLEELSFSFGPGAAFGVRGDTSVFNKVNSTLECTYAFVGRLQEFLEEFPGWVPPGIHDVRIISGSQLTVVPKNAKTDRPICIEPLLNGLYQKGFGSYIRNRLSRFGVDLNDQSVNQRLAGLAIERELATVDLKSASDTISYLLVMDLLPQPWFEVLDVARSPRFLSEGKWYNFHKFTSMGNAYTFELETLIFYALATSVCEELKIDYTTGENLSVYGDDIIIPRAAFDLFSEVIEVCGFALNKEKSFSEGQFFESCGHDFFMGHFVRPFLLSKKLNTLPAAFYAANSIKRISKRFASIALLTGDDSFPYISGHLFDLHAWIVGCIRPQSRLVGPEGYGDGHLIGAVDKADTTRHPSWDGWWFYTIVERPTRQSLVDVPTAYALYFARSLSPSDVDASQRLIHLRKEPDPVDNGSGYSVRGRTYLKRTKVFCNFTWQDITWT